MPMAEIELYFEATPIPSVTTTAPASYVLCRPN